MDGLAGEDHTLPDRHLHPGRTDLHTHGLWRGGGAEPFNTPRVEWHKDTRHSHVT